MAPRWVQQAALNLIGRERYVVTGQHVSRLPHLRHGAVADPTARIFPALTAFAIALIQAPTPRGE
jgi:hypothetical protein